MMNIVEVWYVYLLWSNHCDGSIWKCQWKFQKWLSGEVMISIWNIRKSLSVTVSGSSLMHQMHDLNGRPGMQQRRCCNDCWVHHREPLHARIAAGSVVANCWEYRITFASFVGSQSSELSWREWSTVIILFNIDKTIYWYIYIYVYIYICIY